MKNREEWRQIVQETKDHPELQRLGEGVFIITIIEKFKFCLNELTAFTTVLYKKHNYITEQYATEIENLSTSRSLLQTLDKPQLQFHDLCLGTSRPLYFILKHCIDSGVRHISASETFSDCRNTVMKQFRQDCYMFLYPILNGKHDTNFVSWEHATGDGHL